jgi:hypothetical protein
LNQSTIDYLKENAISREDFKKGFGLIEVYEDKRSLRFVKSNKYNIKIDRFLYCFKTKRVYFLNMHEGKIIGYCFLALKDFGKAFSFTSLNNIYQKLDIDKKINESLDSITTHFNILELDLDKPITIFDDVRNSIFYNNSVYALDKYYIYDYFKPQYFFANNKHGLFRRIEKKKKDFKSFDWKSYLKSNKITNKIYDLKGLINLDSKKLENQKVFENFFN